MTDARALAKAAGAASRLAPQVSALARLGDDLGVTIARQANAVLEELDLLCHLLREALLAGAIDAQPALGQLDVPLHVEAALDRQTPQAAREGVYVVVVDGDRAFSGWAETAESRARVRVASAPPAKPARRKA